MYIYIYIFIYIYSCVLTFKRLLYNLVIWLTQRGCRTSKFLISLMTQYTNSYNKANEMHNFLNLFNKVLYMFRTGPLSIIRSISTLYTRNRYLSCFFCGCLLADANRTSMTNTYCAYTVLRYSWWWRVDLSETCRVLYRINLRNCASRWLLL